MEAYKASREYKDMRDDLYSAGMDYGLELLRKRNPNLDTTDFDVDMESSETIPEEVAEGTEVRVQP